MSDDSFWPPSEAFLNISSLIQATDGRARCTGVAICDDQGRPTRVFYQGQIAHFYYEFEILEAIGLPGGGLSFRDGSGCIIHGKNTFQYGSPAPLIVQAGTRLRYHQALHLKIAPRDYWLTVGLASTDAKSYQAYREGELRHEQFNQSIRQHCRFTDVGPFTVQLDPDGKLLHHGLVDLPGACEVRVENGTSVEIPAPFSLRMEAPARPTVFHVTHWKAGSQWIYRILQGCVSKGDIVQPQLNQSQFLRQPLQLGKVYPTVYVTKQQFDNVSLPPGWRRFVVIRDLRDTLVSAYFSLKISHPILNDWTARQRDKLQSLNLEEGLLYLVDTWLTQSAHIQRSWLASGDRLIRYEDLLERDLDILELVLLDECQLPVSRERFREIVLACRFERLTKRKPGQEDVNAHNRKGIAGDWRNCFTPRVTEAFKARYGDVLIAAGYEQDLTW